MRRKSVIEIGAPLDSADHPLYFLKMDGESWCKTNTIQGHISFVKQPPIDASLVHMSKVVSHTVSLRVPGFCEQIIDTHAPRESGRGDFLKTAPYRKRANRL